MWYVLVKYKFDEKSKYDVLPETNVFYEEFTPKKGDKVTFFLDDEDKTEIEGVFVTRSTDKKKLLEVIREHVNSQKSEDPVMFCAVQFPGGEMNVFPESAVINNGEKLKKNDLVKIKKDTNSSPVKAKFLLQGSDENKLIRYISLLRSKKPDEDETQLHPNGTSSVSEASLLSLEVQASEADLTPSSSSETEDEVPAKKRKEKDGNTSAKKEKEKDDNSSAKKRIEKGDNVSAKKRKEKDNNASAKKINNPRAKKNGNTSAPERVLSPVLATHTRKKSATNQNKHGQNRSDESNKENIPSNGDLDKLFRKQLYGKRYSKAVMVSIGKGIYCKNYNYQDAKNNGHTPGEATAKLIRGVLKRKAILYGTRSGKRGRNIPDEKKSEPVHMIYPKAVNAMIACGKRLAKENAKLRGKKKIKIPCREILEQSFTRALVYQKSKVREELEELEKSGERDEEEDEENVDSESEQEQEQDEGDVEEVSDGNEEEDDTDNDSEEQ